MVRTSSKRTAEAAGLDEAHLRKTMLKECNDVLGIKQEPISDDTSHDDSEYEPYDWADMGDVKHPPPPSNVDNKAIAICNITAPDEISAAFEDMSLNACLEVLQYTQPDRDLYSSAVREVLQHARESPEQASSVMAALSLRLAHDKLDPIVKALDEVACCHHAVGLAAAVSKASISSPSTLRCTLSAFYHALPATLRTSLPEVLVDFIGTPCHDAARSALTPPSSVQYHGTPDTVASRPRAVDRGVVKRRRTKAPMAIPTARSTSEHEPIQLQPAGHEHTTSRMPLPAVNATAAAQPGSSQQGPRNGEDWPAPTLIPFTNSDKTPQMVLYTIDAPGIPVRTLTAGQLLSACATVLGRNNVKQARQLNHHVWIVIMRDSGIVALAQKRSIQLQGCSLTAEYCLYRPPRVFTWQVQHGILPAIEVGRRLKAAFEADHSDLEIRHRHVKPTGDDPANLSCFFARFNRPPWLSSFFVPMRVRDAIVHAWFKPLNHSAPCVICKDTGHPKVSVCKEARPIKGL
ncbi:hypothetical protein B0A55_09677 [Friedmanniomyces simplex]|uniref:Uncharacterized protein n=1 Tax=Friedmanniomyces simplex TaxID=329884 RepID=A0A4U0X024_9PEZI|nr:hypothetical protein B0A55_09677 [Friedmanniomyces simplex]